MPLIRALLLIIVLFVSTRANAADLLAVLELPTGDADQRVLAQLSDKLREGALDTIRSASADIDVITRESMIAILNDMGNKAAFTARRDSGRFNESAGSVPESDPGEQRQRAGVWQQRRRQCHWRILWWSADGCLW